MSHRPTVLLVEDEEGLREVVFEALVRAGWEAYQAATGEDALAQIARHPRIDALFTDIRLPGTVNGWDIAEAFRARHERGAVIYATGYSATHTPVSASMFFRKPYKTQQVLLCLEALIPPGRRPSVSRADTTGSCEDDTQRG